MKEKIDINKLIKDVDILKKAEEMYVVGGKIKEKDLVRRFDI